MTQCGSSKFQGGTPLSCWLSIFSPDFDLTSLFDGDDNISDGDVLLNEDSDINVQLGSDHQDDEMGETDQTTEKDR